MRRGATLAASVALMMGLGSRALADEAIKSIDIPTTDGIRVRADVYEPSTPPKAIVLLFHQAGWSRGEYREIAPRLAAAGYRAIAVDQRSGGAVRNVSNETHARAKKRKVPTHYLAAYPDLEAALKYARETTPSARVIAWGSSYSASLVIRLAAEHPADVAAVLAFSPGEYFRKAEGNAYVTSLASKVQQPLFVTSAKPERPQVKPIFDASPSKKKVLFTPASKGQHGSRALWSKWNDNDVYWTAVNGFLETYAPADR